MNTILSLKSTPVYTIQNLSQFPLNPYREFVFFCATEIYPKLENKLELSLDAFSKLSGDEQKNILLGIVEAIPNAEIKFLEKTSHQKIFLEAEFYHKSSKIALLQFFTHMTYVSTSSNETNEEYVACELNFTSFDGFDFLNVQRNDNILDFSKDDKDTGAIDMLAAHLKGLADFTEFVKSYKAKSLVIKNINLFTDKLVKPYVSDIQNAFSPEHFLIGVLCGENIHKMTYPYENYLNSIKEFAKAIQDRYGDKFKVENEAKQNKEKED